MILLVILTGCANPTHTPPSAVATASPDQPAARPLACSEFAPIPYHLGKITEAGAPDLTEADIKLALTSHPNPVSHIRRMTGDTDSTIAAIKVHNAVYDALCAHPNGATR